MPHRHKSAAARPSPARRSIASLAARLMAEDGISDYGLAKRKAARQLGVPENEALPNNAEVEVELRAYQAIYQQDEQRERLRHLRTVAVEAMRMLSRFSPYLTGAVLDGTAGRFATVELQTYTDSAKAVEIFLLDRGIAYRHGDTRRGHGESPEAVLEFEGAGVPVSVGVFDRFAARAQQRNPRNGRVAERAPLAAVEALLEQAA